MNERAKRRHSASLATIHLPNLRENSNWNGTFCISNENRSLDLPAPTFQLMSAASCIKSFPSSSTTTGWQFWSETSSWWHEMNCITCMIQSQHKLISDQNCRPVEKARVVEGKWKSNKMRQLKLFEGDEMAVEVDRPNVTEGGRSGSGGSLQVSTKNQQNGTLLPHEKMRSKTRKAL